MLPAIDIACPYCGESIAVLVDASGGDQHYVEDCQVCCRPIEFVLAFDDDGTPGLQARRGDEA